MKILISICSLLFLLNGAVFAQDNENVGNNEEKKEKKVDKPVRSPFGSGYLIDNQTTYVPIKKTLEFAIQHKFGTMDNGFSDLFGIYAPGANIRLALNYVVIDNVQIGYGITKNKMHSDFNIKWSILKQTRKNTIPVAVTAYANMAIDGRNESVFGSEYVKQNRLSYFSQLIVSRKFNNWLTVQAAGSFTHYNSVDTTANHDVVGLHFNGRVKLSPQSSVLFNYDIPLNIKSLYSKYGNTALIPKPNLAIGWEISTSTHAFHIYVGTASGLIPQELIMYNQNDFTKGELAFGFSITRLWNF